MYELSFKAIVIIITTIILVGISGFYFGWSMAHRFKDGDIAHVIGLIKPTPFPTPNGSIAPPPTPNPQTKITSVYGLIIKAENNTLTVLNEKNQTLTLPVAKNFTIYVPIPGTNTGRASQNLSEVDKSQKAIILLNQVDGQYQVTTISYPPKLTNISSSISK